MVQRENISILEKIDFFRSNVFWRRCRLLLHSTTFTVTTHGCKIQKCKTTLSKKITRNKRTIGYKLSIENVAMEQVLSCALSTQIELPKVGNTNLAITCRSSLRVVVFFCAADLGRGIVGQRNSNLSTRRWTRSGYFECNCSGPRRTYSISYQWSVWGRKNSFSCCPTGGLLFFDPSLQLMVLTKENVAAHVVAEHLVSLQLPDHIQGKKRRLVGYYEQNRKGFYIPLDIRTPVQALLFFFG